LQDAPPEPAQAIKTLMKDISKAKGNAMTKSMEIAHLRVDATLVKQLKACSSCMEKMYGVLHAISVKKIIDGTRFQEASDKAKRLLEIYEEKMQFAKAYLNVHKKQHDKA